MNQYNVTKIAGPYVFNDDDQLLNADGSIREPTPGHRLEMLKGKGTKGKPMVWYEIPDLSTQFVLQIEHENDGTAKQIGAMLFDMMDKNQKLRLNAFDDGEIAARDWIIDAANLAERYFVDGRSLGVKQAMIEDWINDVLHDYMITRIAKNQGFNQAQRESLVGALHQKFLIAATRDNETKDKRGNILFVPKDQLLDLQKRLEQYGSDEGNLLEPCEELDALTGRIKKHLLTEKLELPITNDQF